MRILSAAICSMVCAVSMQAQAPYLVSDINTSYTPSAQSSFPRSFTASGASVYFSATTAATGTELFKTDGVTASLVKDIRTGVNGSGPASFVDLGNGTIVFGATDDSHGRELWVSDGTDNGTTLVKDIVPGISSSSPAPFAALGGKAFFLTADELWVTDGQEGGTVKLAGPFGTVAFRSVVMGGVLYFSPGDTLWRSDGTPGGTSIVKTGIYPRALAATADQLFLAAWDQTHGYELWKSDGTQGGTTIVKDINAGASGAFITNATITLGVTGSSIVFFAYDGTHGLSLWRSDGTDSGTVLYHEFLNNSSTVSPALSSAAGVVFFNLQGSLWRTDGTDAGTFSLATVLDAYGFARTPTTLYFVARDASTGYRLWSSDGSDAGTAKIAPNVTVAEADPQLRYTGGRLYFAGSNGLTGAEPWTSDGTAAGTVILANLMADPPASANPTDLRGSAGKLFFLANDGTAPSQIWASDGSGPGTLKLTNFSDSGSSTANTLTPWNGRLFFKHLGEFWQSDGTAAGTALLKTMNVVTTFAATNYTYFTGSTTNSYYDSQLWRTDGTDAGTIKLGDIPSPTFIGELAGRTYFLSDANLWRTDGTADSTQKIISLGYTVGTPVLAAGTLFYSAGPSYPNYELWKSDGTPEGSLLVKEIRPGTSGSNPHNLTPAGTLVFFIANDGVHGDELWRSDGTDAGTFLLKDIVAGSGSSSPSSLVAVNGVVFFTANNGVDGTELWTSDGTVAGTTLVADIAPGSTSSDPQQLVAADGKLFFSASNAASGAELWTSDGTAGGTAMVADLEPGTGPSSPRELTPAGRRLYFSASTSAGRELWALPLATSAFAINDARTVEADAGTTLLHFIITRSGDLSQAATVAYTTSDGTATAGSDYTAASGLLSFGVGIASAGLDVVVASDDVIEHNEILFVTLSAPSTGAIERIRGIGFIEDDDRTAALNVGLVHGRGSFSSTRIIVVTNAGPSSATNVQLVYSESPRSLTFYSYSGDICTGSNGRIVCSIGTLLPGENRTVQFSANFPSLGVYYDALNPPGQTLTASVTATEFDPDLTDNSASRMTNLSGAIMTPPFLVAGTTAAATFLLDYTSSGTTSVSVQSSNPLVVPSPASLTIPPGETAAAFTLQVGNGTGTTLLSTNTMNTANGMIIPIVLNGQTPKLDTVITGPYYTTYANYGSDVVIPAGVAARLPDGTYPTGVLELLDESNAVLAQQNVGPTGGVTFTRSGLQPGSYVYRLRYSGDAHFNALGPVTIPAVTVRGWYTSVTVTVPKVICGNTIDVMAIVSATASTQPPTGQVRISFGNQILLLDLVPTSAPGKSRATAQLALPSYSYYVDVSYLPTGTFEGSSNYNYLPTIGGCAPVGLNATATASNRIALSWSPTGASSYEIFRTTEYYGVSSIGYATTNSYIDTQVEANRTYIYRVRPVGGAMSEPEIATTAFFTDDALVPGVTTIKAAHFAELWTILNYARSTAGLYVANGTIPPFPGLPVRAADIDELRAAVEEARRYLGVLPTTYTDPSLTAGTPIKATHIQQLRNALK